MCGLDSRRWFAVLHLAAICSATSFALTQSSEARGADQAEVRAAVEFVLEQGGQVSCRIDRKFGTIQKGKPIPEGELEITSITFANSKITDDDLKRLAPLAEIKTLALNLHGTAITDAGLVHVAAVTGLRQLFLDNTKITDAGLKNLAKLKGLRTISLRRTAITDEGLKTLAAFTPLNGLNLTETQITDSGVALIAKMPHVNQLSLEGTAITGKGLIELQRMESLISLDLNGCDLTDADIEALKKLKRLRTLRVVDTKLTTAGIESLEKAMSPTKVYSSKLGGMVVRGGVAVPAGGTVIIPAGAIIAPLERNPGPAGAGFGPRARPTPGLQVKSVAGPGQPRVMPIEEVLEAVPPFLKGATAHYDFGFMNGIDPEQGYVEVEIGKDTALYLAVTFYANDAASGKSAPKGETSNYRRMNRDGWVYVGSSKVVQGLGPRRDLFWKQFTKGDKFRLRTSMHYIPTVISPATPDSNPLDQVPSDGMYPSEARSALKSKVERLLRLRKFDELEALVAGFRRDKAYDRHGESWLKTFYDGTTPGDEAEVDRAAVLKLLEDWRDAKPESAAPLYALTDYWNEYAWKARRAGYDRSDEAFRLQRERYRKARESLDQAAKLKQRDPYYFHLEGESALYHGGTAEKMEKVFEDSLKFDPDFFFPLTAGGRFFQPRWHGGDMEKYAARCADRTKERHGDSLYTLCAISEADDDGLQTAKSYGFDWARLKRGFADLRKRFPDSAEYDQWNCKFAGLYEDRSETQAAFARLLRHPAELYYIDREMEKWRRWAGTDFLSGDQAAVYETLKRSVHRLEWTLDEKNWIVLDEQAELAVYDAQNGKLLSSVATHTPKPRDAVLIPFSKTMIAVGEDHKVRAYKIPSGEVRELGDHGAVVRTSALASDGAEFATLGADGLIKFWDLSGKDPTPYDWDLSPLRTTALAYVPSTRNMAVSNDERRVGFYNRESLKKSIELAPRSTPIRDLLVAPSGELLGVVDMREVSIWRLKDWEQTSTVSLGQDAVGEFQFSRDGRYLAAIAIVRAAADRPEIRVWKTTDGSLVKTFRGHKGAIRSFGFSPDGKKIVSGSDDMTIRVWQVE